LQPSAATISGYVLPCLNTIFSYYTDYQPDWYNFDTSRLFLV